MNEKIVKIADELKEVLEKDVGLTHGLKRGIRKLLSEYVIYENHMNNNLKNEVNHEALKVQVGGGSHVLEGFLNIDAFPPADVVYDVREGLPLKSESAELIFSEHFLEHIDYPVSAFKFINESFRSLKSGGSLVIGVPDAEVIVNKFYNKDLNFFKDMINRWYSKRESDFVLSTYSDLLNYNFRDQDDSNKYTPHLWAYDYEKLKDLCLKCGFSTVDKWKPDLNLVNEKRIWSSVYIEAHKI